MIGWKPLFFFGSKEDTVVVFPGGWQMGSDASMLHALLMLLIRDRRRMAWFGHHRR